MKFPVRGSRWSAPAGQGQLCRYPCSGVCWSKLHRPCYAGAMKSYQKMTKQEAAAALQEFLEERPRALENLRQLLGERSGGTVTLDWTVESLIPLWCWVKSVLTERTTEPTDIEVSAGPTWLRYRVGTEPTLSSESVALIDGVISYLCRVVEQGAPHAKWRVGYNRVTSYMWQNHPVLVHDDGEVPLAALVPGKARGQASGRHPSDDGELARVAAAVIKQLNATAQEAPLEEEPLFEVEDVGEDEVQNRALEVSLREDISYQHSEDIDRLIEILENEEGISSAFREDREVFLVFTPSWSTEQLHHWVARYIQMNIHS